jgi:signal transduction histidine kinase
MTIAASALAWSLLRRTTGPLADLMEAAQRVAEGDYSTRIEERGPPGMRALVRAFNSMSARLQASDEQRRNLLADVTHELRTPVTIVQGNLEALLDGVYPADEAHLTTILDETHQLARLIDDLRTLALAESGALRLQREPTDVEALVGETVASFRAQADDAGIGLTADIDPNTPLLVIDPARIREVLGNLIGNALRHTPPGGSVTTRCRPVERAVVFEVLDTGVGIPAEELPHIFDRFHRTRDSGGMGLGLAIARNLVVAHGGDISLESTVGQGTTLRFTLPVVDAG